MIERLYLKALAYLAEGLSQKGLERMILRVITRRVEILQTHEALSFLFRIEAALYPLEGQAAINYGPGIHPKHRLTTYHEFFVGRVTKGERVLDVGCGLGAVAYDIASSAGAVVDGVDYSTENITKAKILFNHKNLRFLEADALHMEIDEVYDTVLLSNVLEHIERRPEFLQRLVRQTGARKVLIRIPVFERDWRVALQREIGQDWRLDLDHKTEYTLESFVKDCAEADLVIQHLEVRWGEIWSELTVPKGK